MRSIPPLRMCLMYDGQAEEAARFYAETFPDSAVEAVQCAPGDNPSGDAGSVLVVEFTVIGIRCIGVNGGARFKHGQAFSFQISTEDQAETDSTGTPSFKMEARKVCAVGARTRGGCLGRSPRER